MTWQDLNIGDIVHMEYMDGDETYLLYSYIENIRNNEITFSDLYCDKGNDFLDNNYIFYFPDSSITFISVVGHHPPVDIYFKSLFPELSL